jgi:hypothetical protein
MSIIFSHVALTQDLEAVTGIVLTEFIKEEDKIRVLYAEQFEDHPDPQMILDKIFEFHKKYFNLWVNIDGSARGFITFIRLHSERIQIMKRLKTYFQVIIRYFPSHLTKIINKC